MYRSRAEAQRLDVADALARDLFDAVGLAQQFAEAIAATDYCRKTPWTWAPIGPSSRRRMRRMLGLEANGAMTQAEFEPLLRQLMKKMPASHLAGIMRRLEAMDVQTCLCEFDKYMRLLNDEGTVRSRYQGEPDVAFGQKRKERSRPRNTV